MELSDRYEALAGLSGEAYARAATERDLELALVDAWLAGYDQALGEVRAILGGSVARRRRSPKEEGGGVSCRQQQQQRL